MKKILSAILVLVMAFSLAGAVSANGMQGPQSTLQFDESGKFKILFMADVQDKYPMKEAAVQFINEVLDACKPDLVIFGGDNIVTDDILAYEQLLAPLVERGVDFTMVFGNHDDESTHLNPEQILVEYQKRPGCLAYDPEPSLHGCATHNLEIKSSDGSKTAFNLWMFDSGDYATYENGESGYDCVRADQIQWYKNQSAALQAANGGELVPSLAFQHIIVQEVYQAAYFKTPKLGKLTKNFCDGTSYGVVPNLFKIDGIIQEGPCPSLDNEGQWDAFVERGDVLGCVFGHDHVNSFVVDFKGVDIIQCPGVSYNSYGNTNVRGATLFTIDESKPFEYEKELITAASLAVKDGSALPGLDGYSKWDYIFANIGRKMIVIIMKMMKLCSALVKAVF
ncbi:MAG TPA: metallophosphoesterase [Clostridia bacterium]|nr:metallophosphoesterase [Clostridia bacterium]